jgi:hypothetical protein
MGFTAKQSPTHAMGRQLLWDRSLEVAFDVGIALLTSKLPTSFQFYFKGRTEKTVTVEELKAMLCALLLSDITSLS